MITHKYLTLLYHSDIQLGLERNETFKVTGQDIITISKKIKLKRQRLRI